MSRKTQCTNGKVLEFQTLCTSFYIEVGNTRKNRVPIDNIKASGLRRQAKRRCLWVGLIIALTAWSTSLRSHFASAKQAQ